MVRAEVKLGSGSILLVGLTRHETELLVAGRALSVLVMVTGPMTLILTGALTNEAVEERMRESIDEGALWVRVPEPQVG